MTTRTLPATAVKAPKSKRTPRIALGVLVAWSAIIVTIGIAAALADPAWPKDDGGLSAADVRVLLAVAVGFAVWFLGLMTIALVTMVVRLGHLTKALQVSR